jgi:hypothetical protein
MRVAGVGTAVVELTDEEFYESLNGIHRHGDGPRADIEAEEAR